MQRRGFDFRRQPQLGNSQRAGAIRGLIQTRGEQRTRGAFAVNFDLVVVLSKSHQTVGGLGIEPQRRINRGPGKRERGHLYSGLREQRDVAIERRTPRNTNQYGGSLANARAVVSGFFFRIRIQRIDLKANRCGQILVRNSRQQHLPDRYFLARQKYRSRQMPGAELLQEAGIFFAPLGGGLLAKAGDHELAQHSHAGRAQADYGGSQVLAAQLNADARPKGEPFSKVRGTHCKGTAFSYQRRT